MLSGLWTVTHVAAALLAGPARRRYDEAAALGTDPAEVVTPYTFALIPGFVLMIAVWVVGSLWLGRAYDNARALAPHRLRRRRVWVWLGWWVPIVSLWFPKMIVDDVWAITSGRGKVARQKATGLWWGLWLAGFLILNGPLNRISLDDPTRGDTALLFTRLLAVGMVAAYIAWLPVVRGLTAAQDELVHSRYGGQAGWTGRV